MLNVRSNLLVMQEGRYSKWVACFGNATSISDRCEAVYAKNITFRYPIKMCFNGNKLRFHFSNLTGTEDVKLTSAYILKAGSEPIQITFDNKESVTLKAGEKDYLSDEIVVDINREDEISVSLYFEDYTQLNAGTLITGPLSKGKYTYGNYVNQENLPVDLTRNTNWYYFLNTIDIYTEEDNYAVVCYGDSITAQSWPDYLTLRNFEENNCNVAVIRKAVSGTRILREYSCITYAAYGLKGATRFPIEANVAGARDIIIQHGINDIIHPVGEEVNIFRPMSDMPTVEELIAGVENIYVNHARKLGLNVYSGTLLPIYGWRTYADFRENIRVEFNDWLKNSTLFDGCIDFDKAVRDERDIRKFKPGFDSGDHLHPSEAAYKAMAECVPAHILHKNSL